jgi:hypothetical protein
MSSQTIYANLFRYWAELARTLRQNFVAEAGLSSGDDVAEHLRKSPYLSNALMALAALVNDCESAATLFDTIERKDLATFEAFQRALEKS